MTNTSPPAVKAIVEPLSVKETEPIPSLFHALSYHLRRVRGMFAMPPAGLSGMRFATGDFSVGSMRQRSSPLRNTMMRPLRETVGRNTWSSVNDVTWRTDAPFASGR